MAIHAFFLPRRDAIFQNFVESSVFLERAIAQAASLNATFAWVLPFTLFVLFFYRRSHDCQAQHLPMKIDVLRRGTGPCLRQSQQ